MYGEDDLLPLSALQHLVFCARQCALIHVEGLWADDARTLDGRHLHERADAAGGEARGDLVIVRALPLRNLALGLGGRADVVEFHRVEHGGAALPGRPGRYRPYPVETKRGGPKLHDADRVQLCGQGLCLEEMFATEVPAGALFYGTPRRREEVAFDDRLRAETRAAAERLRALLAAGTTPPAVREPKCDRCSLLDLCLPGALGRSASAYLSRALAAALADGAARAEGPP